MKIAIASALLFLPAALAFAPNQPAFRTKITSLKSTETATEKKVRKVSNGIRLM